MEAKRVYPQQHQEDDEDLFLQDDPADDDDSLPDEDHPMEDPSFDPKKPLPRKLSDFDELP